MPNTAPSIHQAATVPHHYLGVRLDQAAAELFPDYSRSRLQNWISQGALRVNGEQKRPKDKLTGGEQLTLDAELEAEGEWVAESIPLAIVYEDDSLLVVNKPAGLVVHPAAGNPDGTLLNALLHHEPQLVNLPRAGIVHRLDKDTTGLMVVAKTLLAQNSLVSQLQQRTVSREYQAVVQGVMTAGGTVDAALGRHPRSRIKRAVLQQGGKPAVSHYRVLKRFTAYTHIQVKLETGRTHQIRVHMAHLGYPLLGDPVYGGRLKLPAQASIELTERLRNFRRQALHAFSLSLEHPQTGEEMSWQAPLPDDFQGLLDALTND